jgi:UrcA family protein
MNSSITKQTSYFLAALATGMLFLTGVHSASAQDPPATASRTRSISLVDLDLSTPEGAQAARERLQQAVKTLCSQLQDNLDLSHRATYLECVDKAMTATNRHLDAVLARVDNVRTAANH